MPPHRGTFAAQVELASQNRIELLDGGHGAAGDYMHRSNSPWWENCIPLPEVRRGLADVQAVLRTPLEGTK